MKVGEYCRNKYGIAKVIDIENNNGIDILVFDKPICFLVDKKTGEIKDDRLLNKLALIDDIDLSKIKHSKKLIDLIEVGDYINGNKIIKICDDFAGRKILVYGYDDGERQVAITIYEEDIKSILTKEQFEAMKYKVKE